MSPTTSGHNMAYTNFMRPQKSHGQLIVIPGWPQYLRNPGIPVTPDWMGLFTTFLACIVYPHFPKWV